MKSLFKSALNVSRKPKFRILDKAEKLESGRIFLIRIISKTF